MLIKRIIEEKMSFLSPSEKAVGRAIIDGKIDTLDGSITKTAKLLGVSPALINKFCTKIGMSGWKEFKALSIASLSKGFNESVDGGEFEKTLALIMNSVFHQTEHLKSVVTKIANRIVKRKRTIIVASEYTLILVKSLAYKLTKLGFNIMVITFENSVRKMFADDHILFISISGVQIKLENFIKRVPKNTLLSCVTLGHIRNSRITGNYSLGKYTMLPKHEKVFPATADIALMTVLNKIFFQIYNKDLNKEIWTEIENTNDGI